MRLRRGHLFFKIPSTFALHLGKVAHNSDSSEPHCDANFGMTMEDFERLDRPGTLVMEKGDQDHVTSCNPVHMISIH